MKLYKVFYKYGLAQASKAGKLYNIFYKGDSNGNPPCYEATTDNFKKWLKEHNARRISEGNEKEDADDFDVEELNLIFYGDKK